MTREEQIKQASLNEDNYILADNEVDCISFQDGARWADSHPNWIDITERIKTFEDAGLWCIKNGKKELTDVYAFIHDNLSNMEGEIDEEDKDILAYLKLRIITAALNEGWEPTFAEDEERWRIVYDAVDGSYSSGCSLKWETTPNKLIFKSNELAQYAAEQFSDIYRDFCGCKKGGSK